MTLNIRHGRGRTRSSEFLRRGRFRRNASRVAAFLREHPADVVALQEADGRSSWSGTFDHVGHIAREAGYPEAAHGLHLSLAHPPMVLEYGTALLSRLPLWDVASFSFRARPFDTKGFVVAAAVLDGREVDIVSVHLDVVPPSRKRQVAAMIRELSGRMRPLVVMGDLNCSGRRGWSAVQSLARGLDLKTAEGSSGAEPTFPAVKPSRRIDWILVSRELKATNCRVLPHDISDHLAVVAEIRGQV
jgi:endonuclease/exonuclease/phosphatase family metal-dependent hydrolase